VDAWSLCLRKVFDAVMASRMFPVITKRRATRQDDSIVLSENEILNFGVEMICGFFNINSSLSVVRVL